MAESPEISLIQESLRHLKAVELDELGDIWRHEGLKKGIETGLHLLGSQNFTRWVLDRVSGGNVTDSRLNTEVAGIEMEGPTGIAPGWDKYGRTILGWQTLGARHITIGGVTLFPQVGLRMPRLRTFDERVGDHGTSRSLNSFGFSSPGSEKVGYNVAKQRDGGEVDIPVIMQVTVNKEFYRPENRHLVPGVIAETVRKVLPVADAINLGLTSPNTLGMRDAQDVWEFTYANVMAAQEVIQGQVPLGFKGDGDGGEARLDMYCRLAIEAGLNYLELINTTGLERIKAKYGAEKLPGGLAGADPEYQQMALKAVKYVYEAVGDKVDIIGMGGINSPDQAFKMLKAGASAIGINTAVRQLGARAAGAIELGLSEKMDELRFGTKLPNIIGIDTARGPKQARAA